MYEAFFGFSERPFNLTPDPDFLYEGPTHGKVIEHIRRGIESGEAFILITGGIGTGKTTLTRHLIRSLEPDASVAHIVNPRGTFREVMRVILDNLGAVPYTQELSRERLIMAFEKFARQQDHPVILIFDEAQSLDPVTLEELRMLSNIETEKEKLVRIILIGQDELKDLIQSPRLKQLDQRIAIRAELKPLSREETAQYIRHRLARSGAKSDGVKLATDTYEMIHIYSQGIPRRINIICNAMLLAGFVDKKRTFTARYIRTTIADLYHSEYDKANLRELGDSVGRQAKEYVQQSRSRRKAILAGAAAALAGAISWLAFFNGFATLKTAVESIF